MHEQRTRTIHSLNMDLRKHLIQTGFYTTWRPCAGNFKNVKNCSYLECNKASITMHLDDALDCFEAGRIKSRPFTDFSILEPWDIEAVNLRAEVVSEICNSEKNSSRQNFDPINDTNELNTFKDDKDSVLGNIKFEIDIGQVVKLDKVPNVNMYIVEVVDMNKYSTIRVLLTLNSFHQFPKTNILSPESPIYTEGNRYYCMNSLENFEGRTVKCFVEILFHSDILDQYKLWEHSALSTLCHEGKKRFRCQRVLDRKAQYCMYNSKEDSIAGLIAWMLIRNRFDIFGKLNNTIKSRLKAVHRKFNISDSSKCRKNSSSDSSSDTSISDIDSGSKFSDSASQSADETYTDTKLNAICDYVAQAFYSSNSSVDLESIQCAIEKCDLNVGIPTKAEIKACLVLILKCVNEATLLHEESKRRTILLNILPCEKFLRTRYKAITPCSNVWCPHEYCSDVSKIGLSYLIHTINRWETEDLET